MQPFAYTHTHRQIQSERDRDRVRQREGGLACLGKEYGNQIMKEDCIWSIGKEQEIQEYCVYTYIHVCDYRLILHPPSCLCHSLSCHGSYHELWD